MSEATKALRDWGQRQLALAERRIAAFEEDFKVHPHSSLQFCNQVHIAVARKKRLESISVAITTGGLTFTEAYDRILMLLVDAAMDAANSSGNAGRDLLNAADLAALGWAAHEMRGMSELDDGGLS